LVIVVYPEEVWYHCANEADVDEIIASHVQGGVVVERLRI
jgi:(2Fe-2S) ferredoxin